MSSRSLSYVGGVFDRAAMILCGSDAVTDPVLGRIITPLPHGIAQLLSSPHLYRNHSIFSILYTVAAPTILHNTDKPSPHVVFIQQLFLRNTV